MLKNLCGTPTASYIFAACLVGSGLIPSAGAAAEPKPLIWKLETVSRIGDYPATVYGSPRVACEADKTALCFNGESDAILLPVNPIAGWAEFTIEALIKPEAIGPEEQRFLHIQDERESRLLLETRLTPEGRWALDTFLFASGDTRLTLLDREKLHPADRWHWVALSFDGQTMSHHVNGRRELEGKIRFQPMTSGRMSLGMRLNKVSWYRGCIREIRFTPRALPPESLQR